MTIPITYGLVLIGLSFPRPSHSRSLSTARRKRSNDKGQSATLFLFSTVRGPGAKAKVVGGAILDADNQASFTVFVLDGESGFNTKC